MNRTQVGIIGAGPAGLMLSHLLQREGIDSVVLERRSRDYVEARIRAGVLEQASTDLLKSAGVGERMQREGLIHDGIRLRFNGEEHRIDFRRLTGRGITVYGQQEVVKDLISRRLEEGGEIWFETEAIDIEDIDRQPRIEYRWAGEDQICNVTSSPDAMDRTASRRSPGNPRVPLNAIGPSPGSASWPERPRRATS